MRRDFRLYELSDDDFEDLCVKISVDWLGKAVTPFAPGPDGGRDGKFTGTANCFPSSAEPLKGKVVLQAKHAASPIASYSDRPFQRKLKNEEYPRIKKLIKDEMCEHYILFANRNLTGGAEKKLHKELMNLGLQSAHIIGTGRLDVELEGNPSLAQSLPNARDAQPFTFQPDDIVEVITALHAYSDGHIDEAFDSAQSFDTISIKAKKNPINGLSKEFYEQVIEAESMLHFGRIERFLKNPRNDEFRELYHDAADELKQKLIVERDQFPDFDRVFTFLYDKVQSQRDALKGKRRLVSILLHYMYCNCDIGVKSEDELAA
ncbi:ABC-three component system protein [uncultured Tateyamaria sp.]|uniref:ABC-three component system protein n=1 Tax=uncultured Tateyamaria sp. TaxID=455651 RepID=UPI00262FDAD9|nr:ABC-three component system protein [uncultured Tateyamaria sp.]